MNYIEQTINYLVDKKLMLEARALKNKDYMLLKQADKIQETIELLEMELEDEKDL